MKSNVFIRHSRLGKLVETRTLHNVWTTYGRTYLAEMVGENGPTAAPTPQRIDRLKYLGLGVGGAYQDVLSLSPPISTAYPVGFAERRWPPDYALDGVTSGDEYDQRDPLSPLIATLERPVRRTGALDPYPGAASDRWYIEPPNLFTTHMSLQEVTVHAFLDATSGDYIIGGLTFLPITEAGLFTSVVSPDGIAYQSLVAYVGFDTITLDATSQLEFIWRVQFT